MLVLVYGLIAIAALATASTLLGFNVDLRIAGLFFDPATRMFSGASWPVATLRDHGALAIVTCVACVIMAFTRHLPWRLPSIPGRTALALTLSLLLGPGLLVNGILKEHWDRPRPVDVVEFGGTKPFVNWWDPRGACDRNCSFISGEAASAAWMFGPAMLVPLPWRPAALAAAALFTAGMSLLRMSVGAHFFMDVVLGALSTMLILLGMLALADRPPSAARTPTKASS